MKSRRRVALYTTFYRGAGEYLASWYSSVRKQSERQFDLWIALDDITVDEAEQDVGQKIVAGWIHNDARGSPACIRNKALTLLGERYDYIVLSDADDILESSRIEGAIRALDTHDLTGCALELIDQSARQLNKVFSPGPGTDLHTLLLTHNIFGLSNTAYRAEVLKACLPIPRECVLIDWLLATRAWALGANLHFDNVPRMYYRQYGANLAGVCLPFSEDRVLNATRLVLGHYSLLLSSSSLPRDKANDIQAAQCRVQQFNAAIKKSPQRLSAYVAALNGLEPRYVWWWCVANSELENLWKN